MGRVHYSPYGSIISSTLTVTATGRLFTGQRFEPSTGGLYDYRARFYDPLTGSFIQPDSIVPELDNPIAWNRYLYVYGNHVRYTDPSGHCPWCVVGVIVALAAIDYAWTAYDLIKLSR